MEDWTSFASAVLTHFTSLASAVLTHFNIKHLEPKGHMHGSHPKSSHVKMLTLDNSGQFNTSDDLSLAWVTGRAAKTCGSVNISFVSFACVYHVYHWGASGNWSWPLKWRRSLAGSPRSVWSWNLHVRTVSASQLLEQETQPQTCQLHCQAKNTLRRLPQIQSQLTHNIPK